MARLLPPLPLRLLLLRLLPQLLLRLLRLLLRLLRRLPEGHLSPSRAGAVGAGPLDGSAQAHLTTTPQYWPHHTPRSRGSYRQSPATVACRAGTRIDAISHAAAAAPASASAASSTAASRGSGGAGGWTGEPGPAAAARHAASCLTLSSPSRRLASQ